MNPVLRLAVVPIITLLLSIGSSAIVCAQTMRAHFLDVGQGSAAVLEFPCAAILVDTGGELNGEFDSTDELIDRLDEFFARRTDLNRTFHSFVLTHQHIDHTRGVKEVLQKYKVLNAVTNGVEDNSSGKAGQKALHNAVALSEHSGGTPIGFEPVRVKNLPTTGLTNAVIDPVSCPTVDPKITALWGFAGPMPGWTKEESKNPNNHSVVLRVDFGSSSMLMTGDLQEKAIASLLTRYKNTGLLDADVYLVGHHGSHNATTDAFLKVVTPKIAVISMGVPGAPYVMDRLGIRPPPQGDCGPSREKRSGDEAGEEGYRRYGTACVCTNDDEQVDLRDRMGRHGCARGGHERKLASSRR
jgi:competence protein ComEC